MDISDKDIKIIIGALRIAEIAATERMDDRLLDGKLGIMAHPQDIVTLTERKEDYVRVRADMETYLAGVYAQRAD